MRGKTVKRAWTSGWLVIHEHPDYTLTDETGAFKLTDVPAGDYQLKFWHETLGEVMQQVSVKPQETTTVAIALGPR
ncbi:MAG: carboxypeptidase-like regulatory domain-containing protein [Candidatus Binatia bacterium]|nr:carboxypeptidase-like regulatory domain-containing protein [Candidatus Binatia bacterium]